MKTGICISDFEVKTAGERVFFDLRIPEDCDEISGVLATVYGWAAPWDFTPRQSRPFYAGQLRLKWREAAGVFYSGEVDFSRGTFADPQAFGAPVLPDLDAGPWHHRGKIVPAPLSVCPCNTLIRGQYRDTLKLGGPKPDQPYRVKVYLFCRKGGRDD